MEITVQNLLGGQCYIIISLNNSFINSVFLVVKQTFCSVIIMITWYFFILLKIPSKVGTHRKIIGAKIKFNISFQ